MQTSPRRPPKPAETAPTQDPRWARVLARDPAADGEFYYAVATTGVYCRPSCPSRVANPKNVSFHASPGEAEAAGFRPCQRCEPHLPPRAIRQAATIAQACRSIDQAEERPTLEELAKQAGLSPHHFHRLFKAVTGITPGAYAAARRAARLQDQLDRARTVTEAIHGAGFGSTSRFYERSGQRLGMTPKAYRAGGAATLIRFAVGQCSLGAILVAMSERGICGILLGDDPESLLQDLQRRFSTARLVGGDKAFESLIAQVVGFVEAPRIGLGLPLDIRGTAFQQRVWQALQGIPPGSTATYAEIAQRIGAPKAARAVAGACAANPLAVAIPCHRVVRNDGALAGYRWGIERKQALLEREGAP